MKRKSRICQLKPGKRKEPEFCSGCGIRKCWEYKQFYQHEKSVDVDTLKESYYYKQDQNKRLQSKTTQCKLNEYHITMAVNGCCFLAERMVPPLHNEKQFRPANNSRLPQAKGE